MIAVPYPNKMEHLSLLVYLRNEDDWNSLAKRHKTLNYQVNELSLRETRLDLRTECYGPLSGRWWALIIDAFQHSELS